VVGLLEIDRVDFGEIDEGLDVDRPVRLVLDRWRRPDPLARRRRFDHPLVADAPTRLASELAEADIALDRGRIQLHRDVHQPE
jgi:hypothetical protein